MEGHGGHGPKLGRADAGDLADERRIVVLASDENFGFFADADDVGSGENERGGGIDGRVSLFGGLGGRGVLLTRRLLETVISGRGAEAVSAWTGTVGAFDAVFTAAALVLFPFLYSGEE